MSSLQPDVAAIVLNYRRADLTITCVESLIGQAGMVVIVENSDDKRQTEQIEHWLSVVSTRTEGTHIVLKSPGGNVGFSRGVNYGIRCVSEMGAIKDVVIINNDAVAGQQMVKALHSVLYKQAEPAIVAASMGENGNTSMFWYHRVLALVLKRPAIGAFPYLGGACLMMPMSLAKGGLFDADFFMYGEDVELSWRMSRRGVPLLVAPEAVCKHVGSASSRMASLFYEYHVARGHLLLANKLARNKFDRLMLLLGRAFSLPLRATLRSVRYRSLTPWCALAHAWMRQSPPAPEK